MHTFHARIIFIFLFLMTHNNLCSADSTFIPIPQKKTSTSTTKKGFYLKAMGALVPMLLFSYMLIRSTSKEPDTKPEKPKPIHQEKIPLPKVTQQRLGTGFFFQTTDAMGKEASVTAFVKSDMVKEADFAFVELAEPITISGRQDSFKHIAVYYGKELSNRLRIMKDSSDVYELKRKDEISDDIHITMQATLLYEEGKAEPIGLIALDKAKVTKKDTPT